MVVSMIRLHIFSILHWLCLLYHSFYMVHNTSMKWIKNWRPYDNIFAKTSKILDDLNDAINFDKFPQNRTPNLFIDGFIDTLSGFQGPLNFKLFKGNSIPTELFNEFFALTRSNMKHLYNISKFNGGWNDRRKSSEIKYHKTHIIALFSKDSLIGFTSYRFIVMRENQDPAPVLYVYELQIKDSYRSRGLGRFFISLLELVARSARCKKLMCTVLTANDRALSFYSEKCRFVADESDPNNKYRVLKLEL
uniref:N-alpha-acetyltransferase 40 n=1 Tax=Theileria annulata TaxID=5874 RepID=A0A3B0MS73_THEAN